MPAQSPSRPAASAARGRVAAVASPGRLRWLALGLVLAGCAATAAPDGTEARLERIDDDLRHGRYVEALQAAAALADEVPDNERAALAHRDVSVAYHLDRARRLSFEDEDDEALTEIDAALAIDPRSPEALAWQVRVKEKLAERWYRNGRESYAQGNYEAAEEAFTRSLGYRPDHAAASYAIDELTEHLVWRDERSGDYYNEGVRSFADGRIPVSRTRFSYAKKYEDSDSDRERIDRRIAEADEELALSWKAKAARQAEVGYWRSALRALELALERDPELEDGEELLAVYRREADAAVELRRASFMRLKGRFGEAREVLHANIDATEHQREAFEAQLAAVDEDEAAAMYQYARDLEYDFRYEEAVAAYERLLEGREYYEDALARLGSLRSNIRRAAELYEEARGAASDAERLLLYRQVDLVWPEYRDVRDRIARLSGEG